MAGNTSGVGMIESPLIRYGEEGAMFARVCPNCNRFVKADNSIILNGLGEYVDRENATCSRCGRVEMPFQGFV